LRTPYAQEAMEKIPFGNTGVNVSKYALGTMNMASSVPADVSRDIITAYWEAGGRFIDTANCYTRWAPGGDGGESEELIGDWLQERSDRDEVFLATKVALPYQDVPPGLAPDIVRQECDRSLKRLKVDCIDLFFAHRDDFNQSIETTLEVFTELQKAGKIKYFGISNFWAYRMSEYLSIAEFKNYMPVSCIQNRYSYARRNPAAEDSETPHISREIQVLCAAKNIPAMAFSSLAKGAYVNPNKPMPPIYAGEDTDLRIAKLREMAEKHGVTANQLVLRWMAEKKDCRVIPLFSASSMAQIEDNLRAATIEFTDEMFEELNSAGVKAK